MVRKVDQVCHYCCCFYSFGGCPVPSFLRYQYLSTCGSHGLLHRYQYSHPPWGNERRASFSSDDASWMLKSRSCAGHYYYAYHLMGVDPYWSSFSWVMLSIAMWRVAVLLLPVASLKMMSSRKQRERLIHLLLRSLMVLLGLLWVFRIRHQTNNRRDWVDCQLTDPLRALILAQTSSWVLSLEERGGACRHWQSLS